MAMKYYNGVQLPEIPGIPSGYAHCFIMNFKNSSTEQTILFCTKVQPYIAPYNDISAIWANDTVTYGYTFDAQQNVWTDSGEAEIYDGYPIMPIDCETGGNTYKLIWTNTNIPEGSADSTDIYMYATYPHDTFWYYNGMKLPEIPADLLEQLPYMAAVRVKTTMTISGLEPIIMNMYMVMLSDKKIYIADVTEEGQTYPFVHFQSNAKAFTFATDYDISNEFMDEGAEIQFIEESTYVIPIASIGDETYKIDYILWCSNHDINYGSPDSTEIYLNGDARPVYTETDLFSVEAGVLIGIGNEVRRLKGSSVTSPLTLEEILDGLKTIVTTTTTE